MHNQKLKEVFFDDNEKLFIDKELCYKTLNAPQFSKYDKSFLAYLYATTRWQEIQQTPWDDEQRSHFLNMQFEAQYKHYLSHYPKADYLMILKNKEPIGRLYIDRDQTSICLIDIAFLPKYKYQGWGTKLLVNILEEAQQSQKKVVIHVENFNPAYQWYLKHGFVNVEDKGVYQYMEWYPD